MAYSSAANHFSGRYTPHPDVSTNSAVGLVTTSGAADVTALLNSMAGFYSRELMADSDTVLLNCEDFWVAYYRDFPLSRWASLWSLRSETVSGTQRIRAIAKNDSRLATLSESLLSVGLNVSGANLVDAYELGANITDLNTKLSNAKVMMSVFRKAA